MSPLPPKPGHRMPLRVHERVIGHLSRGLYRSPASAFRELISNAYDADATVVRVNLNPPHFTQVVISDNGRGFSSESFVALMSGDIGNSTKRSAQSESSFGRQPIGRLGIGMLGVGLICHSFQIASRTEDGKEWQARVIFRPDMKESLDLANDTKVKDHELEVGTYELSEAVTIPFESTGTTIVADRLHSTFIETFMSDYLEGRALDLPQGWKEVMTFFAKDKSSLSGMGEYLRTIWEIAASVPVPYFDLPSSVPEAVTNEQVSLIQANFKVLLDGRRLYKPVDFAAFPNIIMSDIEPRVLEVYGRKLQFSGYLMARNGQQLYPDALRGLLLRVRKVGIGGYDPSFLDYPVNEGPRTRWITGEVFVSEGLEEALNIDRDSFNRFDPCYRELSKVVHLELKKVVSELNRRQGERNEERRKNRELRAAVTQGEVSQRREKEKQNVSVVDSLLTGFERLRNDPDGISKFRQLAEELLLKNG